MKILMVGNKYGVAIDGRFEAFYDTMAEAAKHKPMPKKKEQPVVVDYKPSEAREVPEIPLNISEELAVDPPYEVVRNSSDS